MEKKVLICGDGNKSKELLKQIINNKDEIKPQVICDNCQYKNTIICEVDKPCVQW